MNWVPKCAVCVANFVLIEGQRNVAIAGNGSGELPALPPVRNAETMFSGTLICRQHVTAAPPAPGDAARAAGLILPG